MTSTQSLGYCSLYVKTNISHKHFLVVIKVLTSSGCLGDIINILLNTILLDNQIQLCMIYPNHITTKYL